MNMAMEPEMIETLTDFGVPSSAFNILSNAGFTTSESLLEANDMLLRSYGIHKGVRVKILSWIFAHKCVFSLTLFSNDYAVGKPAPFRSDFEFSRWSPYVNRVIGQGDDELIEVLLLLKEGNQNVREMARTLNIPMKKLKLLIRHTPIPLNGDTNSFPKDESWLEQLPTFNTNRGHQQQQTPVGGSTNSSVAGSVNGDEVNSNSSSVYESSSSHHHHSTTTGNQSTSGSVTNNNTKSKSAASKPRRSNMVPPEWPVAVYAFKSSEKTAATLANDRLKLLLRPVTAPSLPSVTPLPAFAKPSNKIDSNTWASRTASVLLSSDVCTSLPTTPIRNRQSKLQQQPSSSFISTVVIKKTPEKMNNRSGGGGDRINMLDRMVNEFTSPTNLSGTKKNEEEIDWRDSIAYVTSRGGAFGSTFSSQNNSYLMSSNGGSGNSQKIGQDILMTTTSPLTITDRLRARTPLRDPNTTYSSGGHSPSGNGRLFHTTASKFRPVYW